MFTNKAKVGGLVLLLAIASQLSQAAFAYPSYYANPYAGYGSPYAGYANPYYGGVYYNPYYRPSVFTTHPVLSGTVVGGAVGALGGAAIGAAESGEGHSSIGADTAVGAGAGAVVGAGVGLIRNKILYGSFF